MKLNYFVAKTCLFLIIALVSANPSANVILQEIVLVPSHKDSRL